MVMGHDIRVQGQGGRRNVSTGYSYPALGRGSELLTLPWVEELTREGLVYTVSNAAADDTSIDFAETAFDADQPQFALRVPSQKLVLPLEIELNLEDCAGADTQFICCFDDQDIGNGTSTSVTPVNLNSASGATSACVARSLYTGNSTAPTTPTEFYRHIETIADAATKPPVNIRWQRETSAIKPYLFGAATLIIYLYGSTAPKGWLKVTYSEFDATPYK